MTDSLTSRVNNAHGQKPQAGLLISGPSGQYDFFITADGSPSICLSNEQFRPEAMHHRQGALSESLFVYHGVLTQALQFGAKPQVLSIGLGCGYNEMIAAAHFISQGVSDFYIESFEGIADIRETFALWLAQPDIKHLEPNSTATPLQTELIKTFEHVATLVSQKFGIEKSKLKAALTPRLALRDWLTPQTQFTKRFGVIFFDAFSRQSTPEVWSDEFLKSFINSTADDICGLATYAATGSLNRALKQCGFTLADMPGFSGKRQSTRAFKTGKLT